MLKKIYFFFILILIFTGRENVFGKELAIYTLTNKERKGDMNQVMGIKEALINKWRDSINNIDKDFDIKNTEALVEALSQPTNANIQRVLLTVGEEGIQVLQDVEEIKDLITCHTSHMLTDKSLELIDHCDYIILPKHTVNKEFEQKISGTRSKLITTIGVPHNRTKEAAESAYQEFMPDLPKAKSYIAILLGGDAPDEKSKQRLFTANFAQELAHYIVKEAHRRQAHVFILNGPRTGSRYPLEPHNIIPTAHKDGKPDYVTQTFVTTLKDKVKAGITLYDFQQNTPGQMDRVLGIIKLAGNKNVFFVPGDSTSSVSETIDVVGPMKVIAYWNTAMNTTHQAHIDSEYNAGRLAYLNEFFIMNPIIKNDNSQSSSAAEQVANTLIKDWAPFLNKQKFLENE